MQSTVLVSGGAGFIGSHTIVQLLEQNYKVVCVDNYSNSSVIALHRIRAIVGPIKSPLLIQVEADLRNEEEVEKVFQTHSIEHVIHFAGLKAVSESVSEPLMYYDNNIVATTVLLRMMNRYNVKRIIFSSSATVYGWNNVSPLSEDMIGGSPASPYGKTKLFIENILQDVCVSDPEFQAVILRYFNPIGAHPSGLIGESPRGIANNLMPHLLKVALGNSPQLMIFGSDYETDDGTAERDYIHVMDLADGHVAAIGLQDNGAHIYNLGLGNPVSVLQLLKCLSHVTNRKIAYQFVERRPGDVQTVFSDPAKALMFMNWKATRGLEEMCEDSWNWALKNPDGYVKELKK